jgi:hypothetical protein
MADNEKNGLNRREFLRKAAITGAVAWSLPVIQSVSASPAYAQACASPNACQHSLGGDSGEGCQGACQDSNPRGCGSACQNICGPTCDCPQNFCPCDEICNVGFWDNCAYIGPECTGPCPC